MSQTRGYQANPLTGVAGSGQVDNESIGFFDVTPVSRIVAPSAPSQVAESLQTAIDAIFADMVTYGLYSPNLE